ncbi:type IV pilus assembly protein PilM [Patescibacteria group bacterium]
MIGVDFSENHIKVVQLKNLGKGRFTLEAGGIGEMPEKAFLSNDKDKLLEASSALKKVLSEANVTVKEAVFALPEASVFFTTLQVPEVPEDQLEQVITLEARRFIPFPIQEVELDWQIIEHDKVKKKITVFIVSALKKTVDRYRQLAELSGIELKVLEVQALALQRSLIPDNFEKPILILELGDSKLNLIVMEGGIPRFGRRFELGSKRLDETIAKTLKVDLNKAREIKENNNLSDVVAGDLTLGKIIEKELNQLTKSIQQSIRIFNTKNPDPVQIVLLSGGGSTLSGLTDYLKNNLPELKFHLADPWKGIEIDSSLKERLQKTAPQFSVVVGLAKRS